MLELTSRGGAAVLTLAGLATLALVATDAGGDGSAAAQLQLITGAAGVLLLVAAVFPRMRIAAVAAAVWVKLTYLLTWPGTVGVTVAAEAVLLVLLAAAGTSLMRDAIREARWNGGQSL